MNVSNKVLVIIFIILLTITGVELFYFFFYQSSVLNKKTANLFPPVNDNKVIPDDNLAVNRNQIEYLKTLKKNNIDQLKIFYSMGGIGIVSNIKNITHNQISFDLTDENGNKSTNIRFPIDESGPIHIYQSNNEVITKANLEDLKEGNEIKFLWIYDLTKQPGKEDIYNNELIIYNNNNEKIY